MADLSSERIQGRDIVTYMYEDGQCVRIVENHGTLSGDVPRLRQNLPPLEGHYEVDGNNIRAISSLPLPPPLDDNSEDISAEFTLLCSIWVNPANHFVKKDKYRSKIPILLKCQGGVCLGKPLSPYIV